MNWELMMRGTLVTAKKDMMIYYRKAPVYIFGLVLPTFLFFAFFVGRQLDMHQYFPGFLAMSLFFTASSVGPLIIPWEKQAGTFERLLSLPLNIPMLILGDSLAGAAFGMIISTAVFIGGFLLVGMTVPLGLLIVLPVFFVVGNVCFAAMGVLLSSPAGKVPANIMMLAALVRFPLIFISGVFVPLSEMTGPGRIVAMFSPLTYLVDGMNASLGQDATIGAVWDVIVLLLFTLIFLASASYVLKRKAMKGL